MQKQPKKIIVIIDLITPLCSEHLFNQAKLVGAEERIQITDFSKKTGVNTIGFFDVSSVTNNGEQIIIMASK